MSQANSQQLRGARLLTLRQLNGLTQAELAATLGVGQAFISQVEKGFKALPQETALAAAARFGLPQSFFTVPPRLTDEGFPTFRKSSKATTREEKIVVSTFNEAARLFDLASEASGYRTADLDSLSDHDTEAAARHVREELDLGPDEPVLNATRAAERLGIGVIHNLLETSVDGADHTGVSQPNPFVSRPLVATLGPLPGAVTRLTVMHELGHLIFDRDRSGPIRGTRSPEEKRAFRFAGAVLLPAQVVRQRVTESLTLQGFLPIKADYGISVSAIIVRAADLGIISPERKRTLMIQHSSSGWRRHEPVPVAEEQPILLQQATSHSIASNARDVADAMGISYVDAQRWTGLPLDPPRDGLADIIELRPQREVRRGHQ